jgi:hypothetical protein
MPEETAVSGPSVGGDAGASKPDGLDAAFDKAFAAIDQGSDTAFVAEAKPAKAASPRAKTTDDTVTEDAAQAPSGDESATTEETAPAAPSASAAPAHWDAKTREAFGKLPPEAQKVVSDLSKNLEAGFTKKSQELAEDKKFATGVRSIITDGHRQQLRASGLVDARGNPDEIAGISRLLQLNDFATKDGPGYVRWLVGQMRVDPRQIFPQLTGGAAPQGQQPPAQQQLDPQVRNLFETTLRLASEVDGFKRQQVMSRFKSADQAIASFRDAKDATGQPVHPHFEQVQTQMDWILRSNPAILAVEDLGERLQKAYDLAVYADPDIRNQTFDSELQKRQADAAKKADLERAKRAKAPIKGQSVAAPATKPKGLDAAGREAMRRMGVS